MWIIIIFIIIMLRLDFCRCCMFLASIWNQLLKVELESALRGVSVAYFKAPFKHILDGS